ncbi:hypothetical protein NKH18_01775 [Streptomyces sp. M10(2022)]
MAKLFGWSEQQLQDEIGTLDPDQAVKIQQAYPLAFFDEHLRHRRGTCSTVHPQPSQQ